MKKLLFSLAAMGLVFAACNKDKDFSGSTLPRQLTTLLDTSLHVSVSSYGWLKFATIEDFSATMDMLHSTYPDPDQLDGFESNFSNYISLRQQYENIDSDTSDSRTALTVDSLIKSNQILGCYDEWFASVLNEDGYIQIGAYIYYYPLSLIQDNTAYRVPEEYAEELYMGADPLGMEGSASFEVYFQPATLGDPLGGGGGGSGSPNPPQTIAEGPICDAPANFTNFWGEDPPFLLTQGNSGTLTQYNNRPVRIKAYRWRLGAGIYSSIGICVKIQKKSLFAGWMKTGGLKMTKVAMAACTEGQINYSNSQNCLSSPFSEQTSPAWPGYQKTDENKFSKTMMYGTMVTIDCMADVVCDYFNFHAWAAYGGQTVEVDVR